MKILHVYKSYYPETQGGVERLIQTLADETHRLGCQNRLITCTFSSHPIKSTENPALEVYYYPITIKLASSPFSYALWNAFPQHVEWADVIHYHFPWPMADWLHCFRRIKKPSLVTYHSDVVRQKILKYVYLPLMHAFLNQVNCIVATSQNYVNTSPVLKKHQKKTQVIPMGIQPERYRVSPEQQEKWREKLPKAFILFVGVLRYYKGLDYLLEALEGTHIPLVVVGDGPLSETLKNKANTLKDTSIIFTGALQDEDLAAIYSLAKMLVIPASHRSEAYCLALVEGLLFGLPLLSTEIGTGTSFVNLKNETGLIVPPCDSKALKENLVRLYQDETLQKRMRKASRHRFEQYFGAQAMAESYKTLYTHVARGSKSQL